MTHTNHRQGTVDSLNRDYVVFMYAATRINDKGAGPKLQEFLRLGLNYGPVNIGSPRVGNLFTVSASALLEGVRGEKKAYVVLDDRHRAEALVKDVAKADLGVSVIVSGLFNEVDGMCRSAGIQRHTAQCSLGVWGKVDKLPQESEVLDISTMCGHGMVSFNLVRRMADDVRNNRLSLEKAAGIMAKPCVCGVFNPARAAELLDQYIAGNPGR
ncbi:MAG: hypothetical protein Q8Q07_02695 [Dehalococcoidales bacterium]|nr:hypothetical protein [Dehalococcoidales bacterium]MDZ4230578.1 hypothetical protein [Dehalococcoidales bacterium]